MRKLVLALFALVAVAAVLWFVRPATLGDAGGLWSFADRTVPAAVAWRATYIHPADASAPAASNSTAASSGKPKPAPVVVTTQPAEVTKLDITFDGVGTVQPIASIVIKPRADSQVTQVPVAEGSAVKEGDLLFQLDDAALKAQLAQADAQITKDKAQLDQNKRDLTRNEDLLKQKFVAPQIVETAQTALNQTTAQLGVDEAQRNGIVTLLSYTQIRASVSGRIGSIAAKPGAAVKAGDTLATLNQMDPIYVAFSAPQNKLGELRAAMAAGKAQVRLRDDKTAPAGSIAFVENTVDTTTGTLGVKALMPNPAEKLWPGAFANVVVVTGSEDNALVVPSASVQIGQKGTYVFVAKDSHANLQFVNVERVVGDLTVVTSGVQAGDQIVVQGQMALTNGAEISVSKPAAPQGGAATEAKTASQG